MSDTPRTDAIAVYVETDKGSGWVVMKEDADKLERELAEAHRTMEYIGTLEYLERLEKAEKAESPSVSRSAPAAPSDGRYNLHIGLRIAPNDYTRFKQLCAEAGLSISSIMKATVYRSLRDGNFGFIFNRDRGYHAQREVSVPPNSKDSRPEANSNGVRRHGGTD